MSCEKGKGNLTDRWTSTSQKTRPNRMTNRKSQCCFLGVISQPGKRSNVQTHWNRNSHTVAVPGVCNLLGIQEIHKPSGERLVDSRKNWRLDLP